MISVINKLINYTKNKILLAELDTYANILNELKSRSFGIRNSFYLIFTY